MWIMEEQSRKESKLRNLYIQRDKLQVKITRTESEKKKIERELTELNSKLRGVNDGIEKLENRKILISTHFIARYVQRVGPATEEEIREKIITPQFEKMVRTLGNGTYPAGNYRVVVEDNKLLTIMINE